jgi:putative endonuclease
MSHNKTGYVYILANRKNGTLYTGVTSDLIRRVSEHKSDTIEGFTKRYKIHDLVYFESTENMLSAIARETCIKRWLRKWKMELIEKDNPEWNDLYPDIVGK